MKVVDLSLPIDQKMPGVDLSVARTLESDGWNASTLNLYSHAGTHMDAPRHFLPHGPTLDQLPPSVFVGPATVINLSPVEPRQLIEIDDLGESVGAVTAGSRLLFRTDWYHRYGTTAYRDELPRISLQFAEWLVDQGVSLIGVEPPSVADVNNIEELTAVHRTLFHGNVVIVEGLANLDELTVPEVQFFAAPLNITGGDGCPVRAIAIES